VKVRVLYFGVLKDLAGGHEETVEMADGADVAALYDHLKNRSSNEGVWRSLAVAVNREYAGRATVLKDGDEVALLPPVSGGSGREARN
jgi:molybdopterin converting factor subunit 1